MQTLLYASNISSRIKPAAAAYADFGKNLSLPPKFKGASPANIILAILVMA